MKTDDENEKEKEPKKDEEKEKEKEKEEEEEEEGEQRDFTKEEKEKESQKCRENMEKLASVVDMVEILAHGNKPFSDDLLSLSLLELVAPPIVKESSHP